MSLNLVPIANDGVKEVFSKMELASLKAKQHAGKNGKVDSFKATLAVTKDGNTYIKSNGDVVKEPNLGETFSIKIKSPNCPKINGIVMNARVVNPQVNAVYATTAEDSTFSTLNISLSAAGLQLPQQQFSRGQGSGK